MKRILVTGASAFVGAHVVAALRQSGFAVHVAGRGDPGIDGVVSHHLDLLSSDADIQKVVADAKATHLIHLAWVVRGDHFNSPSHLDWVGPSVDLLRAFAENGGRRAVGVGTALEYTLGPGPLVEGRTPCRPASLYGVAKDATRRLWEGYAASSGISVAWPRLFHVYGPGDRPGRLIYDSIRSLLLGRPFKAGDGTQRYDFAHVTDIADALVAIVDSDVRGAVNLGSGQVASVRSVLERIGTVIASPQLIEFGAFPLRAHDVSFAPGLGRMLDEVGYRPRIGIDEGLADTIDWHRRDLARSTTYPAMAS